MAKGPVDRRKPYVRIADELRRDIASGVYPVGDTLPPGARLAHQHGVSGMTISNAIAVLREEGLVTTRQGARGATVIATPDTQDANETTPERSEEFRLLFTQLQDIRGQLRRLATRLDDLDERTKDL
ncbi:winged helix-turn-helix domain-containing protein [Actinomadura decatromicini]|uniref:Winged helix-turn-helix transcriptional regulator n=1 Tax=Actinomadura decatromicini TaxID=2604572 RepID=A0A5D3FVF8_9ACTN|nr:winged helix-turn-helix domain-containing protein [Actinomadura decatromicini]TYK51115.1 winged helix-turn-helix transcriptional regulator [Actinomadura decatromicini]